MTDIDYSFGTGDGVVHEWSSAADPALAGTGLSDAVRLDFDGDGLADDALWDSAGTGIADIAALDLDDDGIPDHFFTDPTGLGTWDHRISGAPADADEEPLAWITRTGPAPGHPASTTPEATGGVPASDGVGPTGDTVRSGCEPVPGEVDPAPGCDVAFVPPGHSLLVEPGEYAGRHGDRRAGLSAAEIPATVAETGS